MESNLMRIIADKQDNKEECALVTVISSTFMNNCQPGAMMVIDQYGLIAGSEIEDINLQEAIRKEAERCISKSLSRKLLLSTEEGSAEVFINALCHKDKLIIVGSGNLVQDIYQIALTLGYNITITDNHAETLTRERFPHAKQLLLGDIIEILKTCQIDENTSIVLSSHHHEWDQAALETVIKSPARYIGAVGNKRKVTRYLSGLSALDITDEQINRVHMPVGLDLGGEGSAEIALSVMAEIQAVKYGHSGGFVTIKHSKRGIEKREDLF